MAVFPADHHVRDAAALSESVAIAARAAADGAIVTLGIQPTRAETGYGYIQRGEKGPISGTYRVARFREKPDLATAERFVADGSYDWNAGIFVIRADLYLRELMLQLPAHAEAFGSLEQVLGLDEYGTRLERVYDGLSSISVDYGIMENAADVLVVPTQCGWSDIGSLDALRELGDTDEHGNRLQGRSVAIESEGSLLWSEGDHVVVGLGLKDMIVAHCRDATLIAPASRAQDVRQVVSRLRELGWEELL